LIFDAPAVRRRLAGRVQDLLGRTLLMLPPERIELRGTSMALVLDTDWFDIQERGDALRSMLASTTAAHDVRLLGPPFEVYARLHLWRLGSKVEVLEQTSSPIAHERNEKHLRIAGPEKVVFVLHGSVPGSHAYGGRRRPLHRGALYVADMNLPWSFTAPGHGIARVVQLERADLGLSAEQIQAAASNVAASPLYDLLRSHMGALCRDAPQLCSTEAADVVGEATLRLAAGLLRTTLEPDDSAAGEALATHLLQRIALFIELNHADSSLGAEVIASKHNISTRYLFKLWSAQPQSLAETLMTTRLAAAERLLLAYPTMTMATVAHRCGFADASHFSRRFRQNYGQSPTEFRQHNRSHVHRARDLG
jgi:AraC-like DNA-binding protein